MANKDLIKSFIVHEVDSMYKDIVQAIEDRNWSKDIISVNMYTSGWDLSEDKNTISGKVVWKLTDSNNEVYSVTLNANYVDVDGDEEFIKVVKSPFIWEEIHFGVAYVLTGDKKYLK